MPSGQPQPRAIGPYRILDLLGEGGMGVVYRAQHRERGERVALKTVRVVAEHDKYGIEEYEHSARFKDAAASSYRRHGVKGLYDSEPALPMSRAAVVLRPMTGSFVERNSSDQPSHAPVRGGVKVCACGGGMFPYGSVCQPLHLPNVDAFSRIFENVLWRFPIHIQHHRECRADSGEVHRPSGQPLDLCERVE